MKFNWTFLSVACILILPWGCSVSRPNTNQTSEIEASASISQSEQVDEAEIMVEQAEATVTVDEVSDDEADETSNDDDDGAGEEEKEEKDDDADRADEASDDDDDDDRTNEESDDDADEKEVDEINTTSETTETDHVDETGEAEQPAEAGQTNASPANLANVISVQATGNPGAYSFSVGISSPDTGCQQYANWWEVLNEDGELIYRRVLLHSHVGEQPFVRSGGTVEIAADEVVWVRAHMNPGGYGGQVFKGSVATSFQMANLDPTFAADAANLAPLPNGCNF